MGTPGRRRGVRARARHGRVPSALLGVTTSARAGEQASSGLHMRACVSLSAASAWPGRRVLVRERQVARTRKDLDPAGRLARSSIARRGIKRSWLVLVGLIFIFVVRSARTMPVKS